MLVIDEIGGAGNLSYKLTLLSNSLCVYHTFLDNDEAGFKGMDKAIVDMEGRFLVTYLDMPKN